MPPTKKISQGGYIRKVSNHDIARAGAKSTIAGSLDYKPQRSRMTTASSMPEKVDEDEAKTLRYADVCYMREPWLNFLHRPYASI